MALDKETTNNKTGGRVQTGGQQQDNREKAVAFINFDFPTKNGEKKRLVSLALMESDPFHKQLIDFLADPATRDENVAKVTGKLIGTVNFSKVGDAAILDL